MSCDEKCNYFKHNGNSLLWTVIQCTIHNKYFIYTTLSDSDQAEMSVFVLAPLPLIKAFLYESVTQQVYSHADLLMSDKPQFCAHLRGFLADTPAHIDPA